MILSPFIPLDTVAKMTAKWQDLPRRTLGQVSSQTQQNQLKNTHVLKSSTRQNFVTMFNREIFTLQSSVRL